MRLLDKVVSFAGDLYTDVSSYDSGEVVLAGINLALSSELLSFPDGYDSFI